MAHARRQSGVYSPSPSPSSFPELSAAPFPALLGPIDHSLGWKKTWETVSVSELVEDSVFEIDQDANVEAACEALLSANVPCLVLTSGEEHICTGLFDYADVNAFLTLAATQHTLTFDDLRSNPKLEDVVKAARTGQVPVRLVSNLSDKNPLVLYPPTSSLIDLLTVFSRGTHRVVIESTDVTGRAMSVISDRQALKWFIQRNTQSIVSPEPESNEQQLKTLFGSPLTTLDIITHQVVTIPSDSSVLDAMRCMFSEGLSSLPVVDPSSGRLLSVISVTDIGKLVMPSQSKAILGVSLEEFVKLIKGPTGMEDGIDQYPVYAVSASSVLLHSAQMLLATNAHRVCVTEDPNDLLACGFGVVSIVDVLSCFAKLASIEADTTSMRRQRRGSSVSNASRNRSRPNSFLWSGAGS